MEHIGIKHYWHTYCRKRIRSCLKLEPMVEKKGEANKVLDLRGMSCPWSILKAKSQLITMEPGEVLEVLSGDPMMIKDFPKVLGQRGHQLIQIKDKQEFSQLYVRRGKSEKGN